VANLTEMMVLSLDSEPLLAESFGELTGFRDDVRVFCCDSAGEYCYGRLAVVSDLDDGGFALNVDKELRGSAML
jgi:hypothetical protein